MKPFKLAFSSLGCPDYDIDGIVAAGRSCGYSGVSLRTVRGVSDLGALEEFSPAALGATRARFEAGGLEVLCLASGVSLGVGAAALEGELEALRSYLGIAAGLGAPLVRVFGGSRGAEPRPPLGEVADAFARACELAGPTGVRLLLETHDEFSRGSSVAALLERLGREDLFVVWDLLHTIRHGESIEETWKAIGPRVRHVHLKDSSACDEKGFDLVLLGKGSLPLRDALSLLEREGYTGYLEFEWEKGWHPEIPGPEIALPHGAGWLEGLCAGIASPSPREPTS